MPKKGANSCSLIFYSNRVIFIYMLNIAFRLTKPKAQRAKGIPGRFPSRLVQVEWKALLSFISFSKLFAWLRIVETSKLKLKKLLKWVGSDKYG